MKVVCQAAWNLTNAIGNLIVIIVAQAGGNNVDKVCIFTDIELYLVYFLFTILCGICRVSFKNKVALKSNEKQII